MNTWIDCNERLPPIDVNAPKYAQRIRVIAGKPGYVGELTYGRNAYAKTEEGRQPNWQESSGRPSVWIPTHWQLMPAEPTTAPIIE